ncbi:nucleotide-binding domain containing protein [Roseinatronobacter sp. S2]|uniref:nucleotide-binding domain containing protein n=1 Tax=Roseinatronobacter sp. S2 TaxID=3035471 RepID=UPI00358DFFD1
MITKVRPGALVIAGGDTSSVTMRKLAPHALDYAGAVEPGIALCFASFVGTHTVLPVVLKGCQMGQIDLFDRLHNAVLPRVS